MPNQTTAPTAPLVDLPALATQIATDSVLFDPDESPFTATVIPGAPKLLLVVGENASGKSLFFRALTGTIAADGPTAITLSIRERAGAGTESMSRLRQVFMFGDEATQSTGATSVQAIQAAFEKNLNRDNGSLLGLDEPELGLSDGYARALGHYIGEQTRTIPDACSGVIVVTHSRPLVEGLCAGHGTDPTLIALGDASAATSVRDWVEHTESRTVTDLLTLPNTGRDRFRATQNLLRNTR